MQRLPSCRTFVRIAASLVAAILVPLPLAHASFVFWDGTGTSWNLVSSWSTDQNATTPDPASPPGASDIANFNIIGVNSPQTVNLNAPQAAIGLNVQTTGSLLIQSGSGTNTLSLGLAGIALVAPAGAVTITAPISLVANQDWANDSAILLNVTNSINLGANTLNVVGQGNVTLGGVLSGSGGLSTNQIGVGTLTLNGASTYTGTTNVTNSTVVLGNASALGSVAGGTTISNAGTLDLAGQTVGAEPVGMSDNGVGANGALVNNSASAASLAGTVTLNAASYLGGTSDITLSGRVIDPAGTSLLTKVGNNTLTLSGTTDNTNLHVAVNSGTLILAKTNTAHNALAIGFGGLSVNGGTAQLAGTGDDQIWDFTDVTVTSGAFDTNGRNETISHLSLQGTGINGAGALVNNAFNTFTTITPLSGTVLTGNATIGITSNSAITINNPISGNFALIKAGPGSLVLNGANTFSGGLVIQNGSLQIDTINNAGANGQLGKNTSVTLGANGQTGTLIYNGGNAASNMPFVLDTGGTGAFYVSGVGVNLTLNGAISGAGTLRVPVGTITLGANNTFTGGLMIDNGEVRIANPGALNSSAPNAVTFSDTSSPTSTGKLSLQGNVTVSGLSTNSSGSSVQDIVEGTGPLTIDNATDNSFAGILRFLSIIKTGSGTLTLTGTSDNIAAGAAVNGGKLVLAKTSSSFPNDVHAIGGGGLTVSGGTVQLAGTGGDQIYDGAFVTVTSGTIDTNARNDSFYALNIQSAGIAGAGALVNSAAGASSIGLINGTTLTGNTTIGVTQSSGSLTLTSAISGNFALTKVGPGTLQLSSNSTFSGGFNLNQGKLLVKSSGAIGAGPLTIASTGTLVVEIDGSANPPKYDHVNVLGQLTLGGTLNVALINGFSPAAGNSFDILDWGTLTGTFNSIQLPSLATGLQWNTSELYTSGVLSVTSAGVPGDFNHNGTVDAPDYVVWRKGLNTIYTPADYGIWRTHFGQTAGSGSAVTNGSSSSAQAIPEPPCLALLLISASLILRCCVQRQARCPSI